MVELQDLTSLLIFVGSQPESVTDFCYLIEFFSSLGIVDCKRHKDIEEGE